MGARLRRAEVRAQGRAQEGVERLKEVSDLGLETFVDPCPNDIGRDVDLHGRGGVGVSGVKSSARPDCTRKTSATPPTSSSGRVDEIADVYISRD